VIVDAAKGVVTTNPTATSSRRRSTAPTRARPRHPRRSPGALKDGTAVPLLANLGKPGGAAEAVELGAEGVGLFRTEFLFLSATQAPTVEEQTGVHRAAAGVPGKKVVVRALDAGADKPLAFLNDAHEDNPALGLRGLRALRASEDILREQLTALANADKATEADLWVMAPMVSTVEETEYFVALAKDYGIKTAGVMVEVPSPRSGRPHPRRSPTSPRSARTTSRSTRWPPTGCSARSRRIRTRGTRPCSASSRRPPTAASATASPSASAARPPPTRCWPSSSSASARRRCRWRRRPSPTCASLLQYTREDAERIAAAALAADDAASARSAAQAAAENAA
jgi:phosphotransferase system enzyme I (PtsI)